MSKKKIKKTKTWKSILLLILIIWIGLFILGNILSLTDMDKISKDGKISAASYIDAYKRWISLNGSINDFKYAYPAEEWLGQHEWANLPADWRPKAGKTVQDVTTLPEDQQIFINQVQAKINNYELTYDDAVDKYPKIAIYLKPAR